MKRLSFITQFKIEFLLLFTGCRKVLGKMPVDCCSLHTIAKVQWQFIGKLSYCQSVSISSKLTMKILVNSAEQCQLR